jgi:F0F1-type ATP synthase membrane subunit b/b'
MSQRPAGRGETTDLTIIDIDSIHRDLDEARARLVEAEWALRHLGPSGAPLEERVQNLILAARSEATQIKAEARQQAESLVREAERLRAMAGQAAAGGSEQAKKQIAQKVSEMVANADQLRINAERRAADLIKEAQEAVAPAQARTEELARLIARQETELGELHAMVKEARTKADSIIRHAQVEAAARVEELTERARQRLEAARIEGERIVAAAHDRARRLTETQ